MITIAEIADKSGVSIASLSLQVGLFMLSEVDAHKD